jgi:hypothetical protein
MWNLLLGDLIFYIIYFFIKLLKFIYFLIIFISTFKSKFINLSIEDAKTSHIYVYDFL